MYHNAISHTWQQSPGGRLLARMDSKGTRKMKNLMKRFATTHRIASSTKKAATNPVGFIAEKALRRIESYGESPRRRGMIRNRVQYYNPRTGSFVKKDAKTGRIIGSKKRLPYKNVRMG